MANTNGYNSQTGEWNDSLTGEFLWCNVNVSEAAPDMMPTAIVPGGFDGPGALAVWLKVLALPAPVPQVQVSFLDWFSVKIFLEPIIRRTRRGDIKT
jgi:hypothetical protein